LGTIITITTDFGTADGYQGVLEGVMAGINPDARVVTISHQVPPGDILGGWYLLKTHHCYFPPGTVHLSVVDPGVGTKRKIIAVTTSLYSFIAPDNGLLSFIPDKEIVSIHSVTNRKYALPPISPVFHGRDIMAPAAAYLSHGVDPSCLGRKCPNMKRLGNTEPVRNGTKLIGRVIRIDRFGNLITDIVNENLPDNIKVKINGKNLGPIRKIFSDVRVGQPLAYIGSGGHLEIAIREGSAQDHFSLSGNRKIEIEVASA
jgi:S-adenosylmethionine hydrolase